MPGELLLVNPRKRRAKRRASPRRTRTHHTARRRRRSPLMAYSHNPAPVRRRRRRLHAVGKVRHRRYRRNPIHKLSMGSIAGMAKDAAIGATGALVVDFAYGYVKTMLPASMQSPTDAAGSISPMYYVGKGGLAILAGVLGSKVTRKAANMAAGSLTISAYEILRSFIPTSVNLGYVNPAQIAANRMPMRQQSMGRFVSGGGGYVPKVNQGKYMGQFVS